MWTNVTQDPERNDCDELVSDNNLVPLLGACFLTFLMVFICVGNGLVFAVYWRCKRLQNTAGFLTVQLAIADFLLGACMPLHIMAFVFRDVFREDIRLCIARYSTAMFTTNASVCSLVALTVDRLAAIFFSLRYQTMTTSRFLAAAVFLVWVPSFTVSFALPFFWHNNWGVDTRNPCKDCDFLLVMKDELIDYIEFPFLILFSFFIMVAYVLILKTALRQSRLIAAQTSVQRIPCAGNDATNTDRGHNNSGSPGVSYFKTQLKITKTATIVLGSFYACWLPFAISAILQQNLGLGNDSAMNQIRTLATLLAVLNSALNPVIYAYRIALFKRELKRIFGLKTETELD